jgi:hypothetical protein
MGFLGFVLVYVGATPSLLSYLHGDMLVLYLSFLRARRRIKATLSFHVLNAIRVVDWLTSTGAVLEASAANEARLKGYVEWLQKMKEQINQNLVDNREGRAGVADLVAQKRWLEPEQLLVEVHHVVQGALQALQRGQQPSDELAARIMHALMCGMCYGYVPPLRPSVLRTLVLPGYRGPCICRGCDRRRECKGNRLVRLEGGGWRLIAPHHKNAKRWGGRLIQYDLPQELCTLLDAHAEWGHARLAWVVQEGQQQPTPNVFVMATSGEALKSSQVSQVWCREALARVDVRFGPQMCRSIFVHERRSADRVEGGLEDEAAAFCMGNTVSTWDAVYDKNYDRRRAQGAVDCMGPWREKVLAKAAAA